MSRAPAFAPLFPEIPLAENAIVAPGEIVVVNFAGGGGASEGITRAMRRPVNIAINHNATALGMHRVNSPYTTHYIEDVWHVDPREAAAGRPVALAQFSPDCTHFSRARGGKPRSKKIRGLAWVAVRWAATVRPRVIILENVDEFTTWGPLDRAGQPIKAQEGRTYNSFRNALKYLGYQVDSRVLRACDYGAGTTRERYFLIARCDGQPIVWPEPTHAAPDDPRVLAGQLQPWPIAADIIDWSLPTRSVFGRKKAIASDSLKRFSIGFHRWALRTTPYLIPDGQAVAFIEKAYGGNYEGPGIPVTAPLDTVTTVDHHRLVTAHISAYYSSNGKGDAGQPVTTPLRTVPTKDRFALTTTSLDDHPTPDMLARARQVYAVLMEHLGADALAGHADHAAQLVHLVVSGRRYVVWDLRFRMLTARELYRSHGFSAEYVIDRTADGRRITLGEQKEMVGNSVPPPPMTALTLSNLAHTYQEAAD